VVFSRCGKFFQRLLNHYPSLQSYISFLSIAHSSSEMCFLLGLLIPVCSLLAHPTGPQILHKAIPAVSLPLPLHPASHLQSRSRRPVSPLNIIQTTSREIGPTVFVFCTPALCCKEKVARQFRLHKQMLKRNHGSPWSGLSRRRGFRRRLHNRVPRKARIRRSWLGEGEGRSVVGGEEGYAGWEIGKV